MMKIIFIFIFFFTSLLAEDLDCFIKNGTKMYLKKVSSLLRNTGDENLTFYEKSDGEKVALKDTLFIKIKNYIFIEEILKRYDLKLVKQYSKDTFLLKTTTSNLLDIVNQLQLDERTIYSYPNFYNRVKQR